MSGTLYSVATPIGNLEDMSYRAVRVLSEVEAIVCEDTRVTAKLLQAYSLKKPLLSLHAHTDERTIGRIIERLRRGESLAYVSDAGTPGVNDPGGKLMAEAQRQGVCVVPIPGASALTAAISVCGFPMEEFTYLGFVPHKKGRATFFEGLAARSIASIFLESTHRVEKTMQNLLNVLPAERLLFCGRELTKQFETLYRGRVEEVLKQLLETSTKGEFIFIVAPDWYREVESADIDKSAK